jgi:tetratricopeptide (TPR) repeat protein
MRVRMRIPYLLFTHLIFTVSLIFGSPPQQPASTSVQALNQEFQAAVSDYQSHQYGKARLILKSLLRRSPDNFDLNELMGLVWRGQGDSEEAEKYLAKAVELKPSSADARMYWASCLIGLRQYSRAQKEFQTAVQLQPTRYDTNHNLGEFYIAEGKLSAAVPYLQMAQQADPSSIPNGHDLALAEIKMGHLNEAEAALKRLLALHPSADVLSLLAAVDERTGQEVRAASEFQLAARMSPTEANMFAWGSDLLLHHALGPAEQVFEQGARLYPRSRRLQIGLGIALYSRSRYGEAVDAISQAIELDPGDPRPYQMLSMIYDIAPPQAPEVTKTLARFAHVEPRNPSALYYYALCLWKGSRAHATLASAERAEGLLKAAVALNPDFADAHLQLGILYWQQHQVTNAMEQYRQAIKVQPKLAEAHYRLAAALVRIGERSQAQRQYEIYSRLHAIQTKAKQQKRSAILEFESILASPAKPSQ